MAQSNSTEESDRRHEDAANAREELNTENHDRDSTDADCRRDAEAAFDRDTEGE